MIYCRPPHSGDEEFDIELSGSHVLEYVQNSDCSKLFENGEFPPTPESLYTNQFFEGCLSEIIGCESCEGAEELYFNKRIRDNTLFLDFKNAVIGWAYNFNLLITRETTQIHITGITESYCDGYRSGGSSSTTVIPIEFTPESTSGKVGPIDLGSVRGECIFVDWEYVPCG